MIQDIINIFNLNLFTTFLISDIIILDFRNLKTLNYKKEKQVRKSFLKNCPKIILGAAFAVTMLMLPQAHATMAMSEAISAQVATPVGAQLGGYFQQLNSYNQAFMNMDMYMLSNKKDREAQKGADKINDRGSIWEMPYGEFGSVPVHNGPNASSSLYGIYVGGDSSIKDLGNGWEGMWGAYAGYNGSRQSFNNVTTYQNGGTFGITGMAFKDDFFVGTTVSVGAGAGKNHSKFSDYDDFAYISTGIAAKTGYNWELADGKFIIQPSLMASYSYIRPFDEWNGTGAHVDADGIHAIQVEPGVKFIGNLKHGWQPYAGVSLVYSIWDKTHFRMNGTALPNLSINPYVKYGLGLRKVWGDRVAGFAQAYFMSGGRNGIGIHGGFRFALGKDGTNEVGNGETPKMEPTKISLNYKK